MDIWTKYQNRVVARKVAARFLLKRAFAFSLDGAYQFLGLPPTASPDEVKHKYQELAFKFHPDRGGDLETMQKLNVAREMIESGGAHHSPSPATDSQDESVWSRVRNVYGPQPSGSFTDSDLRRFAQDVLDKSLLQVVSRYKVAWVPMDAGVPHGGRWTYYRPFGAKARTQRLVDVTPDKLYDTLKAFGKGRIFDMVVRDKIAWVTWELPGDDGYQSISFEEVRVAPKKDPNVGMTPQAAHDYLEAAGFVVMAGGTKYGYWAPRGYRDKTGYFIREAKKTMRVIWRHRAYGRSIEDSGISQEVYFGALTPAVLDKWMTHIKTHPAAEQ